MNSGNELYLISDATCIQREIHMFKFHQSGLSLCFMTPYQPAALFVQKVGAYLSTFALLVVLVLSVLRSHLPFDVDFVFTIVHAPSCVYFYLHRCVVYMVFKLWRNSVG